MNFITLNSFCPFIITLLYHFNLLIKTCLYFTPSSHFVKWVIPKGENNRITFRANPLMRIGLFIIFNIKFFYSVSKPGEDSFENIPLLCNYLNDIGARGEMLHINEVYIFIFCYNSSHCIIYQYLPYPITFNSYRR